MRVTSLGFDVLSPFIFMRNDVIALSFLDFECLERKLFSFLPLVYLRHPSNKTFRLCHRESARRALPPAEA